MTAAPSTVGSCSLHSMPAIGFGTLLIDPPNVKAALRSAVLDAGFRRIDCAPVYFNEHAVGDALAELLEEGLVQRDDLYLVSKLPSPLHGNVEAAVQKTLADLRVEYLDLYLIHWPVAFEAVPLPPEGTRGWLNEDIDDSGDGRKIDPNVSIHDTWRGMQDVVEKGLVRSIGVSNFPAILLHELLAQKPAIPPAVNQCEFHPYHSQVALRKYCAARGIHFQAYSPLGSAGYKEAHEPTVLEDPLLVDLATRKYPDSTPAQIALAWALHHNVSVVVKSESPEHQRDNTAAAQLTLDEHDVAAIDKLNRNYRYFRPEEWWPEFPLAVFH